MKKIVINLIAICLGMMLTAGASFAADTSTGFTTDYSKDGLYYHNIQFEDAIVVQGLDLSTWQNQISVATFKKMKAQGVDFVILRVGYSNCLTKAADRNRNLDDCFEVNYENAREAGLEVGAYYYSVATSVAEAKKEANFTIEHIEGKDITYPVFIDAEDKIQGDATSKSTLAKICNTFCQLVKESNPNLEVGVYSGLNFFNNQIGDIDPEYVKWVAQYNWRCQYEGEYIMWQYGSSGKLDGFEKRVDCNFRYFDDSYSTGPGSLSDASIKLSKTSYSFDGSQKKPSATVSLNGKTLREGIDYNLAYYHNVQAGTSYVIARGIGSYCDIKIASFKINGVPMTDFEIASIPNKKYTGNAIKPTVKVINSASGEVLTKSGNYTVSYKNNTNVGTATVTVKGKGNLQGTITQTFKIVKGTPTIECADSFSKNGKVTFSLGVTTTGDGKLTYTSSNPEIATVSADGKVKTLAVGEAIITIKSSATNNSNANSKDVTVKVVGQVKGFMADEVKANSASLSWTNILLAESYKVYKYDSSSKTYKLYEETAENYLDVTGLKGNTTYKFRVRLVDVNGKLGAKSETLEFTTPLPAMSGLKVKSKTSTSCTLSWKKLSSAKGYKIYKYNTKTKKLTLVKTISKNSTLSYKITKLKAGTKYTYKVRTYADKVNGPLKAITFTTKAAE